MLRGRKRKPAGGAERSQIPEVAEAAAVTKASVMGQALTEVPALPVITTFPLFGSPIPGRPVLENLFATYHILDNLPALMVGKSESQIAKAQEEVERLKTLADSYIPQTLGLDTVKDRRVFVTRLGKGGLPAELESAFTEFVEALRPCGSPDSKISLPSGVSPADSEIPSATSTAGRPESTMPFKRVRFALPESARALDAEVETVG